MDVLEVFRIHRLIQQDLPVQWAQRMQKQRSVRAELNVLILIVISNIQMDGIRVLMESTVKFMNVLLIILTNDQDHVVIAIDVKIINANSYIQKHVQSNVRYEQNVSIGIAKNFIHFSVLDDVLTKKNARIYHVYVYIHHSVVNYCVPAVQIVMIFLVG